MPSKSDSILGHPWQTNFRGKLNDRLKAEQKQVALLAGFEPSLNVLITRLVTEALDLREQQRSK